MTQKNGSQQAGSLPNWDLSALYSSMTCPKLEKDYSQLETKIKDFSDNYYQKVTSLSTNELAQAIQSYEEMQEIMGRIMSYAYLVYATDMSSEEVGRFYQNQEERVNSLSTKLLFFSLEFNQIEDQKLDEALNESETLKRYQPWIRDLRVYKPYQLNEDLEKLLQEKSVVSRSAWSRLFNETITKIRVQVDDEDLSCREALNRVSDPDEETRKKAAYGLSKAFEEKSDVIAQVMNVLAKDKEITDQWRKMPRVDTARNLGNYVEDEIVDALTSTVKDSYSKLSHRFYALKAKWFGKEKLNMWDLNAPLMGDDGKISWDEAKNIVLDAYAGFSPEMAKIGQRFFDENWIDADVKDGKAGGAFAHPTVPSAHPYILVNYQDKLRDVMTLAHELGHGVHQYLAYDQGYLMADTSIVLSETASVFGEMLTFNALLERMESEQQKKALIASKVQDMLSTVARQISFYFFEKRVHEGRRKSELTKQQICDFWMDEQKQCLGPAFEYEEYYKYFWSYIPHFIEVPFYVYGYAFGDCLVNTLYAQFENQPEGFQEKYIALLQAGGTKRHKEILAPFGLDASQADFWQKGLNMIEGLIDQLDECSLKL